VTLHPENPLSSATTKRSYRRAFSTLGFPEADLAGAFALAARHDLDGVELRALERSLDLPQYFADRFGTPAALAAQIVQEEWRVVSLDTSVRLLTATAAERELLLAFVPWAEACGAPYLRVFDGGTTAGPNEIARAAENLRWWRDLRSKHGWKTDLMIETHDALVTTGAIRRLLEVVPDAAILWDSHHTWYKGGELPADTWRAIGSNVVHIHVNESLARGAEESRPIHMPPGTGEFPMKSLLAALGQKFQGVISLEWEKYWIPAMPPLELALASAGGLDWW